MTPLLQLYVLTACLFWASAIIETVRGEYPRDVITILGSVAMGLIPGLNLVLTVTNVVNFLEDYQTPKKES